MDPQKGQSQLSLKYAYIFSPVGRSLLMNFTMGSMRDAQLVSSALTYRGHVTLANMSSGISQCLAKEVLNFGNVARSLRISSGR
jgi:hypothetical protein